MRFSARAAFCLFLLGAAAAPVSAKDVSFSSDSSKLTFSLPDNWEAKPMKRGLEIKSSDGEVFLWIESYRKSEAEIKAEHGKYFQSQGVAFTGEPKITAQPAQGYGLAFMDMPATWKGKPTVLRYIFIEPANAAKNSMMLSYWASPEGDKANDAAMGKLIESLSQAVDKAMQ